MESKSWQQEMRRRSQPTSSTAINEGNIGNRVNRKRNRIGHRYRTRAALNEEQEDEEYENPNNASTASASSVSSNDNDSIATDIAHEEDLCSDNTTESSTDIEDRLSTSKPRLTSCRNLRLQKVSQDWKLACRQLLETLWQCEDSIPFREPVDRLEHPEYYQIIHTPMDLRTVKEDLLGDNYETPAEFAKDMKLIFTNSRNFNTNKCSSIYLMTIRLSAMFEDQMHRILLNWKSAHRRKNTIKRETKTKRKRKIQKKKPNLSNDTDSTTKSSTEIDVEDRPSTSKPRSASSRNVRLQQISQDWKLACRQLLETLWQCEDSIPFREPMDRLEHPEYYQIINTPMDLRTVKEDLLGDNYETPAEFAKDMRLIFTNSRKFNTNKCSKIYLMTIRLSAMFEDQMHRIFLNWKLAHRRKNIIKHETKTKRKRKIQKKKPNLSSDTDSTTKSSTEIEVEDRPSTSKPRSASSRNVRLQQISQDWKLACHKLLETLWQCEDSIYFREPMDRLELPEYYEIIDTPMDLRIVKEYLLGDNYETPVEFAKDVELILANSRNFNPNKHSSMHSMRLSAMFEEHMLRILLNWISARRRKKTTKAKIKTNQEPNLKLSKSKSAPSDEETDVDVVGLSEHDDDVSNKEQKKIKTNQKPNLRSSKSKSAPSDEEMDIDVVGLSEHDDDEVSDKEQKKKNFDISVPGPSQMTNSHTKLSYSGLFRRVLKRICRSTVAKKPKNSDSESETTSYTDSINSASVGTKARTAIPSISADTDSDSDYTSDDRRKQVRKNCGKNIKNGKQSKSKVTPNVIANDDNDNDEYVAESKMNEDNEEDEEVILVLDSTDEESKEEKITKGDTRSQNLTTKSVQNQKYTTNNEKNDNRDSEEHDEEEEEEELKSEEEEEVEQQLQHKTKKYLLRSSRRSSSWKRSCYNEDSDDSTTLVKNRRKIKHRS